MKIRYIVGGFVVFLFVGFFIIQYSRNTPSGVFERFLLKPIPNSVQSIEKGRFATPNGVLLVLRFQISKADLQTVLDKQHFTPVDGGLEFRRWESQGYVQISKNEFLDDWRGRIHSLTKLEVNFTDSEQIYVLKKEGAEEHIFFNTNSVEEAFAVFVTNTH